MDSLSCCISNTYFNAWFEDELGFVEDLKKQNVNSSHFLPFELDWKLFGRNIANSSPYFFLE